MSEDLATELDLDLDFDLNLDNVQLNNGDDDETMLCSEVVFIPSVGMMIVKDAGIEDGCDLDSAIEDVDLVRLDRIYLPNAMCML
jgi:hypothetical protein